MTTEDSDDLDLLLRNVARAPPRPLDARHVDSDRYDLGALLGEGSFGSVHEAYDRTRGEHVALKILRRTSSDALLRFKREFRVLSRLSDPSLVRLYELHGDGDRWYFTMQRIDGVPFDVWVRDPDRRRPAFESLFSALARLNERGIVHRDLKPSNVLVDRSGAVVLLDFGLLHTFDDAESTAVGGTPAYVAPEVAAGSTPVPASDWYSVGVMLYEALTGDLPFSGSAEEIIRQKQRGLAASVLERAPNAPSDLARVCDGLLRVRPEERVPVTVQQVPRVTRVAFIGRDDELASLFEELDACTAGSRVVRVIGPSGVGKSSLLQRFAALARERGTSVLISRCDPSDHVPFLALDGLVDGLARMLARMPSARVRALVPRHVRALVRAFPVLRSLPGFAPDGQVERTEGARSDVGAALCELLERLGGSWVLAVDDAQWADVDSAAILRDVLRELRVCLVLVERRDTSRAATAAFLEDVSGRDVVIGALNDEDARALARESGAAVSEVEAIVEDSRGHPLFLVEMARDRVKAKLGDGAGRSLGDIVLDRFDALSVEARRCARILAAAGRPIELAVLRELGIAASALDELRDATLVSAHDVDSARIYHDRVREVIADTITTEAARAIHEQLAHAALAVAPDRAEVLAFHFERAGDDAAAMHHLVRAARHATSTRAFARARALYSQLLAGRERLAKADGLDLEIRVESAEASSRMGMSVEAAEGFLAASRLASREPALELRLRAAEQLLTAGHIERGEKILDEQLRHLGLATPTSTPGRLANAARNALGKRLDRLRPEPASEMRASALWSAFCGAMGVNPVRALTLGASLAREAARPGASARARLRAALIDALSIVSPRGPDALPRALGDLALAVDDRSAPEVAELYALSDAVVRYFGLAFRESAGAFDRVTELNLARGAGRSFEETLARGLRSATAWVLGDVEHLRATVPGLCAEHEERDHLAGWILVAMHAMWLTLMEHGPCAEVDAQIDTVAQRWKSRGQDLQTWWVDLAKVHVALIQGDGRTAWTLSRPQARPYSERFSATLMHRLEAQTFLVRGAIHIGMKSPSSDEVKVARKTVEGLARVPSAWTRAHARCLDAGLRSVVGDREGALRALRAALPALDDAGMIFMRTLASLALGRVLAGDEGKTLVRAAEHQLAAWRFDRDIALASTLPGAW